MKVNSGQAPSTLIPEYLGSDFDAVLSCADNMTDIKTVFENLNDIEAVVDNMGNVTTIVNNINYVKDVVNNITDVTTVGHHIDDVGVIANNIVDVNTVASNIDDVGAVVTNIEYVKNVAEGIAGLPVSGYIGDTPPTQPKEGATWYCTLDGRNYIWYADDDSGQWVESSPQSDLPTATDKMILNAAATDAETTTALVNQIRAELIAKGLAQ